MLGKHRQPAGDRQMLLAGHVQPLEILAGDVGVGTHVDNVDAVHAVVVLQLLDRPGDYAARNQALAETGLIGDQEAPTRLRVSIETVGDVLDRGALEVLQGLQNRTGVEAAHDATSASWARAAHTRSHSAAKPSGKTRRLSDRWSRSTSGAMSASTDGAVPRARTRVSNTPS